MSVPRVPDVDGGVVRRCGSGCAGAQALPARADARAALPLQPGLRRLRQDPVPRPRSCKQAPHRRAVPARRSTSAGRPMVSHPRRRAAAVPARSASSSQELVARKKYIYLCTNAILLKEKLEAGLFTPSKYLTFSVHMDGLREEHDEAVCREGVYDQAVEGDPRGARGAASASRPTRRSSTAPTRSGCATFFDEMMDLGVEGMMVSPGYSYAKAPDQEHFLRRAADPRAVPHASSIEPKRRWRFNQSPLFLAVPHGQAGLRVHAVGQPDLQHLRLAAALLPAPGGLRRDLPGADGDDAVGAVRRGERQPRVPGLHGALRLRADGGQRHLRDLEGLPRHRGGDGQRSCRDDRRRADPGGLDAGAGRRPCRSDGSSITPSTTAATSRSCRPTAASSTATSSTANAATRASPSCRCSTGPANGPIRIPYADIRTIRFTGKDTAAGQLLRRLAAPARAGALGRGGASDAGCAG